ncbi:MAG: Ferredoxin--NADP reductase [Pseudomonadota bacterium]
MLNSTVVGRVDITPELMILRVKPDGGVPAFQPGQYVALGLPGAAPRYPGAPEESEVPAADKLIKRAYSIGSSPVAGDFFEFYIAIVANGALTSRLAMVKEGDRIFSQPKVTGTFTLEGVPEDHNLVLVSTGTGLAPFMSMVRTPSVWTPQRRITIVHGVRYPQDFAYADELSSFASANSRFTYLPIASRADGSFVGRKGRVQALFDDGSIQLQPETDHVFLCGNPAMIDDLERDLTTKLGYVVHSKKTPGNLHVEKYW